MSTTLHIVFIIPSRYAGADALERMGELYREAAELAEGYYDAFYNETRLAGKGRAEIEEETGVAALEKDLLQKKIAQPLSKILCSDSPQCSKS